MNHEHKWITCPNCKRPKHKDRECVCKKEREVESEVLKNGK